MKRTRNLRELEALAHAAEARRALLEDEAIALVKATGRYAIQRLCQEGSQKPNGVEMDS